MQVVAGGIAVARLQRVASGQVALKPFSLLCSGLLCLQATMQDACRPSR